MKNICLFRLQTSSNCCWKASPTTVTELKLPKLNYPSNVRGNCMQFIHKQYSSYSNKSFSNFCFCLATRLVFWKISSIFSPSNSSYSSFSFFCISFTFSVCFTFFAICLQSIAAGTHFCMQLDTLMVVFDAIPLQQQLLHNATNHQLCTEHKRNIVILLFYDFMTVILICSLHCDF